MNNGIKGKVEIESYNSLFGLGETMENYEVEEMPLHKLYTFKNHPFHVVDDDKMKELVQSIQEKGVLSPAIVRKIDEDGYEIISGHRRKRACEIAGLLTMPVIVRELSDKDATILMVDANIQRENVLPSERANAYKMRMEAEGKQGERSDLTSDQVGPKLTTSKIGEDNGISGTQVKRYIRLTNLLPELLKRVDEKNIGFIPGVELSFLETEEQSWVLAVLNESGKKITLKQAEQLHKLSEEKALTEDLVCMTIIGKPVIKRTVSFTEKELRQFFPPDMPAETIKDVITELIKEWKEGEK